MNSKLLMAGLILAAGAALCQTKINLATQSQVVDFSGASFTKPFRAGAALPATCTPGETFYLSTATPGTNLYACTAANQWTVLAGSSLPTSVGQTGGVLTNNGSTANWVLLGGDVTGTPASSEVSGLLGVPLAPTAPVDGQALVFNATLNRWQPGSGGNVPDWPVTRTSDTVLTIGSGPGVRMGSTYCQVPATTGTITVGGGTGTIFVFIRPTCELVAAHNLQIASCSNCTATTGAAFEANSFPLAEWNVTGGVLAPQGIYAVTPYSVQPLGAGTNIQLTYSGGQTQISAPNLPVNHPTRMLGYTFDVGGGPLFPVTKYVTVPFACTITGWNMTADAGTATVQVLKVPSGTAIPTGINSILNSGLSLTTGNAVHSNDLSPFSTLAISQNDILGFSLTAVSGASYLNFILECVQ